MPKIACLLTSYNRPLTLDQAIQSVLDQTCTDFELLILDDNSSDPQVAEIIGQYWNTPGVSVLKSAVSDQERLMTARYATMINLGLMVTTAPYITYLCDDDYYLADRFEAMTAMLDAGHDVVYGSQLMMPGETLRDTSTRDTCGIITEKPRGLVDHNSVMHTRAAACAAGGWDDAPERWGDADAAFFERLTAAGYAFVPVPDGPFEVKRYHPRMVQQLRGPY